MEIMEIIQIDNIKYYLAEKLKELSPIYFKGTSRGVRVIIKKKNIHENDYIFGINNDGIWIKTDGNSKKLDKLLLTVEFVKNNVPEFANKEELKHEIEEAPKIIELTNDEKMKDNDNNTIEVEVIGEREFDKCYFKVKDIETGFNLQRLTDILTNKQSEYELKKHYIFFNCKIPITNGKRATKKVIKKEIYLTYIGLLRVLFVTRSRKTDNFIKWASEILFTHQLGTTKQKDTLIGKMKGVSYDRIQELFSINSRTLPCIYLTCLGSVKQLRNKMNLDNKYKDDEYIYKFGLTEDFEKRKNGHKSEYKELENYSEMKLVCFSFIDPSNIRDAETDLKQILANYKVEFKEHNELVILSQNILDLVKDSYKALAYKYSGHTKEFVEEKTGLLTLIKDIESKSKYEKLELQSKYDKEQIELQSKYEKLEITSKHEKEYYTLMLKYKDIELKNKELEMKAILTDEKNKIKIL
jgi:hypothetical protein